DVGVQRSPALSAVISTSSGWGNTMLRLLLVAWAVTGGCAAALSFPAPWVPSTPVVRLEPDATTLRQFDPLLARVVVQAGPNRDFLMPSCLGGEYESVSFEVRPTGGAMRAARALWYGLICAEPEVTAIPAKDRMACYELLANS